MKNQINWKYFLSTLVVIIVTLSSLSGYVLYIIYQTNIKTNRKILLSSELTETKILNKIIRNNFQGIVSDLLIISRSHELNKYINSNNYFTHDINSDLLNIAKEKALFDQIRYIDKTGQERIRINYNNGNPKVVPNNKLQNKANRYYFKDTYALNKNEVYISPLDLNIEHGKIELPHKPMIRFATPILNSNGEKSGIIILNYLAEPMINLLQTVSSQGLGHFSLLNSDSYWIKGPDPNAEWGFMYKERIDKTFNNKFPHEWNTMLKSDSGQFMNENGVFTFETFYPFYNQQEKPHNWNKEYFFKIVSHIPETDLKKNRARTLRPLLKLYLFILSLLGIIAITITYFIESKIRIDLQRKTLINELKQASNEIQSLQGILPICAKCKKIRDSKGYWNQVESYIEKHSEAKFSHGLCENCADELYRDQQWYQKQKKTKNKHSEE